MTKDEIKSSVLTGIVSGVTTALMLVVLIFGYLELESWYREYKHEQELKEHLMDNPDDYAVKYSGRKSTELPGDTIE